MVKPVEVAWHTEEGIYVKKQAHTEEVSAHGALPRAEHDLPVRGVIALKQGTATNWAHGAGSALLPCSARWSDTGCC